MATVSGNVKTLTTGALTAAKVRFFLTNYTGIARVIGTGALAQPVTEVESDANGAFSLTLYGNDVIDPAGTFYSVFFTDLSTGRTIGPVNFNITGATFDLNSAPPVTSGQQFAPAGVLSNLNTRILNQIRLADQFPGADAGAKIAAAIADLPSTGGIVDARGLEGAQTSGALTISANNVTLLLGNATFTFTGQLLISGSRNSIVGLDWDKTTLRKGFNGHLIHVGGNDVAIKGLKLEGVRATFTGRGIQWNTESVGPTLTGALLERVWVDGTASYGAILIRVVEAYILNNKFTDCTSDSLAIRGNAARVRISGNSIDRPDNAANFDPIVVFGGDAGESPEDVVISQNTIRAGQGSTFCIEVGAFGGNPPRKIVVSNNVCKATGNNYGGISFSRVTDSIIADNVWDSGGFSAGTISGIELVNTDGITVTGNTVRAGNKGKGFSASGTTNRNITITGNLFDGTIAQSPGVNAVFHISGSSTGSNFDNWIIANNVVLVPADDGGGGTRVGIWVQSNNTTADFNNFQITGNVVVGTGAETGIRLNRDLGTFTNARVSNNVLQSLGTGIVTHPGITRLDVVANQFQNVTNKFGGSVSATETRFFEPFDRGVFADGAGIKHRRVTTGSISASSTADVTVTWTTAFADANYTVFVEVLEGTAGNTLEVLKIVSQAAGSVVVRVRNNDTTARTGTLHCIAVHD